MPQDRKISDKPVMNPACEQWRSQQGFAGTTRNASGRTAGVIGTRECGSERREQTLARQPIFGPVRQDLIGDNGPSVRPGDDPSLYGQAVLSNAGQPAEVRSFQTYSLSYTVGRIGLDDTGSIRVATRIVSDAGKPQITDAAAPNYLSARCSGRGRIALRVGPDGQRPWVLAVTAELRGGYLSEGDEIVLTFGDTSGGSPGMAMQTFAEGGYALKVAADVQATGNYQPLAGDFTFPVVAGPPVRWVAVLPTLRRPGETFHLGLKAEDLWGNPTAQARGRVEFRPSMPVAGLPATLDYAPEDRALMLEGLSADEGELRIVVLVDGQPVAEAGPLVIRPGTVAGYWGDLHGQTGETVGVNTIEGYFDFARNKAFLDVAAHQGNDFQINQAFWQHLNALTAEENQPGRFTVFPGYEWSGNTAVGGDHNVFFAEEGQAIRRCSHALLEDRSEADSDAHTLTDLYSALHSQDAVIYAHVGGRYADISYYHDPVLETAVEVHSAWGTFEWVLTDGFPLGRRVGVVANSDGHKGRPGASWPGASTFGAYGGLTCFLAPENTRGAIMEAQRRRHHFATTGCRMQIEVEVDLPDGSVVFDRNPAGAADSTAMPANSAAMGDIVQVAGDSVSFAAELCAHAGIERVDLLDGSGVIETYRPYGADDLGQRIRVIWSGAEYRGRGRDTRWQGRADFSSAAIRKMQKINLWNPERLFEQRGSSQVVWDTITTGNFMGFDAWLDPDGAGRAPDGTLGITTNLGSITVAVGDLGLDDVVMEAGGLDRRLRIFRMPDDPLPRTLSLRRHVPVRDGADTPLWLRVTTEDGYQGWTSPVYLFRSDD